MPRAIAVRAPVIGAGLGDTGATSVNMAQPPISGSY